MFRPLPAPLIVPGVLFGASARSPAHGQAFRQAGPRPRRPAAAARGGARDMYQLQDRGHVGEVRLEEERSALSCDEFNLGDAAMHAE